MEVDVPGEIAPLKNCETQRGKVSKQVIGFALGVDLLTWQLIAVHRVHKSPLIDGPITSKSCEPKLFIKELLLRWKRLLIPRVNL